MRPEDILNHDFLVGLRGYDKDEVRAFLAEVAAEHAALLAVAARAPAPTTTTMMGDNFENLGAGVAAILRTAQESANEITNEAESRARAMLEDAERVRSQAEGSVQAMREKVAADAEGLRQQAQQQVAEARAEADRLISAATERARQIEVEHEARMNEKAEEITRREGAIRQRLLEAADELQLALVALSGGSSLAGTDHQDEQQHALG